MAIFRNQFNRIPMVTSIAIALWITVLTLAPHYAFRPLHLGFHYFLLPFLLGVHLYFRWRVKGISLFRSLGWPGLSMILYLVLAAISYYWGDKTGSVALHLLAVFRNILVPFAVFWLIRYTHLGNDQIRILVPVMALLSVINVLISLLAWFKPQYLPSIWPALLSDIGEIRITGTFTNPDILSCALALYSSFILQEAIQWKTGFYRLFLLSVCSLSWSGIVLTFSRTSWIGLVFLLLITFIVYGRGLVKLDLIGLLPGVLLLAIIFAFPPNTLEEQRKAFSNTLLPSNTMQMTGNRITSPSQIRSRILTGYAGIRMFSERPIWGWGYETYNLHAKKFVKPVGSLKATEYEKERAPSHNTFITMLAETGVLGLLLYTFPFAWWGFLAVRNRHLYVVSLPSKSFLDFRFFIILWTNLAFIFLISQSIDIRFFPFSLVQIWLILGLLSNLIQPDNGSVLG
jgi:O-antigen ligase